MSYSSLHLVKRGRNYYFRRAIPDDLAKLLVCREIKVSLRTSDAIRGRIRARYLSSTLDLAFRDLRQMTAISNDVIYERAKDYFRKRLSKSLEHAFLLPREEDWDRHAEIAYLHDHEAELRERLVSQNFTPSIQSDALDLLNISNPTPGTKVSEAFQLACNAIARAKIEDARILAAQFSGQYEKTLPLDPLFAGIVVTELPPLPGEKPTQACKTVAAVSDMFFAFKSKSDWASKTSADVKRVIALALNIVDGDRAFKSIGIDDVKAVRDALQSIPPNYMKMSSHAGLSAKEAIEANVSKDTLSIKTQDKYFTMFRQLLIWACNEGYIDKVPGAGVKIAGVGKLVPGDQRDPYSPEQLKRIFTSPLYKGHLSVVTRHKPGKLTTRDGKFWAPLIALYSGMRMGEIVQLLASDIKFENGVWYFDISKGEGKSLKTASSKRRVPVHKTLLDFGLLDFLKAFSGNERIFPEIEKGKDGYSSHNLSKWWGRYARHINVASERTAFHSFRHNFASALRAAELPEYINKTLMGHADKSVHSQYGGAGNLSQLKTAIDKIEFDLDLSHLLGSKL